jgi:hypothetical protein
MQKAEERQETPPQCPRLAGILHSAFFLLHSSKALDKPT